MTWHCVSKTHSCVTFTSRFKHRNNFCLTIWLFVCLCIILWRWPTLTGDTYVSWEHCFWYFETNAFLICACFLLRFTVFQNYLCCVTTTSHPNSHIHIVWNYTCLLFASDWFPLLEQGGTKDVTSPGHKPATHCLESRCLTTLPWGIHRWPAFMYVSATNQYSFFFLSNAHKVNNKSKLCKDDSAIFMSDTLFQTSCVQFEDWRCRDPLLGKNKDSLDVLTDCLMLNI